MEGQRIDRRFAGAGRDVSRIRRLRSDMKIFISSSGERGEKVARALRSWLGDVHHKLEPWVSSEDIEAGQRWDVALAKQLEDTVCGIVCLTPESAKKPWVLFEAGALAKTVGSSHVCPYLLDMTSEAVRPPLSQFESVEADEKGTLKMLRSINRLLGQEALTEDRLLRSFHKWWPDLEQALQAIPKPRIASDDLSAVAGCLGLERVFASRSEALTCFHDEFEREIERSRCKNENMIHFVSTSMRGFLVADARDFDGPHLIEELVENRVNLRIMLTQPQFAELRAEREKRTAGAITHEIEGAVTQLRTLGVDSAHIKFYSGTPTVFGIATSEAMLLNPYPYEDESHRCMTMIVRKTENKQDIYHQYFKAHFARPWEHATLVAADGRAVDATDGTLPTQKTEESAAPAQKKAARLRRAIASGQAVVDDSLSPSAFQVSATEISDESAHTSEEAKPTS
jgi:hypothetical protein